MAIRIGFDARMIYHSGIGTFICNFLDLASNNKNCEFVLFGNPAALHRYPFKVEPFTKNIYSISEQLHWPAVYGKHDIEILHLPHYNFPLTHKGKKIIHIHDIIHLLFPQFLPNRLAYYYAKFFLNQAVLRSDAIIVNSIATKRDIIKNLRANPDRIKVVYYAVAEGFKEFSDETRKEKLYILEKYNLPEKYVLYLGNIRLLKNIPNLVAGFRIFKRKTKSDYHLVCAGRNFLPKWYLEANKSDFVHFTGELGKDDLPAVYNYATAFIFPSLYEGFGLPVLEAMACGVPVICSKKGSLEEIAGHAAYFIDERDIKSIADAIELFLSDPQLRHNYRHRGLSQVKKFDWRKTVDDIFNIYKEITV